MQISWHGQYTVKIVSKDTTVIFDPYSPSVGLSPFRAKADVVVLSNPADSSMSNLSSIQGDPIIIDTPGEYSVKGLTLYALGWMPSEGTERNLQRWVIEDMVVLHVGALTRELEEKELQELERTDIDVLIVPVGGGSGLTTAQALHLVATLEPRVVIPIHYKLSVLAEDLVDVKKFAEEMGVDASHAEKKLILKKGKLPQEDVLTSILIP
ncbi:MAG TPA: MBL fold metallo-hydrolase [Candidatus Andersenbacteria bacterium]|nr:MBL fold metallo-hydrolase [Candidatus Andersenbacteria bacterium]